jgi:DNA-binding SARP family transcriptional activator
MIKEVIRLIEQILIDSNLNKLQIFTLGQFKIYLENGDVHNISSRSNKLWNLFKFLLLNKDKGMPPEIILENLYPDEDYEDPQNAFQNMIYRLRKLLLSEHIFENSKANITFANGCYKLDTQDKIWLDFDTFEECIKSAERIKKEKPLESIELYKNALDVYTGELLPELIYEDWIIPKRTYYNNLYLQSVLKLSELYREQNQYDLIVQTCQKAILIEPYEEEIHILLLENLMKMGKIREAKKHYEDMVKTFDKQYGIKPTEEMQRIYQMLKTDYIVLKNSNSDISKHLLGVEEKNGAFYCEYRDFYAISILEKRRNERSGEAFCPVSISLDNGKNIYKTNTLKNNAINIFKKILITSLRSGDMFTIINKAQFLIMLPNMEYKQVKFVMDRVINRFNNEDAFKDIHLEVEAYPTLLRKIK